MKLVKVFDDLNLMPIGVMNLDQLRDEMGDAVVESVAVVDGNLVITFNTASGKQPITIPLSELSQPLVIETTYAELVAAKNGGTLAKGAWYRITDYVTTTAKSDTQSANHAFDVIVRADSEGVLNENAFAIQHEGDTYFANQKLSAWELKYDINNDTNKYDWADATNGKGVIYYMKDENDNECPYDFKNIQFKVGANQQAGTITNVFYFTFSVATGTDDTTVTDHSLNGVYCHGNKMGLYTSSNKRSLNASVFRDGNAMVGCFNNKFGDNCYNNKFGNNCTNNTFGFNCANNTFGFNCADNTFGFNCQNNKFGNFCTNNKFGNFCSDNKFGSSSGTKDYYKHVIFENGVANVILDCTQTTSSSAYCQNVLVGMGVKGADLSKKTLTVATAGNAFKTVFKTANDVEVTA